MMEMDVVKISSRGQIVIPAKIRKEFGLDKGDKLLIERRGDSIILKPVVRLSKLRGVDRLEGASQEVDKIREEWDREFDVR